MKLLLAACATIAITAGAAVAQDRPQAHAATGGLRIACKADLEKLCAGVQPGGGRIRDCMKAHRDQLSEGCKSAIASAMSH